MVSSPISSGIHMAIFGQVKMALFHDSSCHNSSAHGGPTQHNTVYNTAIGGSSLAHLSLICGFPSCMVLPLGKSLSLTEVSDVE